jgi:hypothetical protein
MKQKHLKDIINFELDKYKEAYRSKNYPFAFKHLERIHIISQPFPLAHTVIHLRMLKFALLRFKPIEILVQFVYSVFSAKFSLLNIFPVGNTGGANAIKKGRMPIPEDLAAIINKTNRR